MVSKFRKRKRKLLFCVPVLEKKWNYALSRCGSETTTKKCTKKVLWTCKIVILPFSLPFLSSLLKLPIRDRNIKRRGRQRERRKKNRFYIKQNNNFARASRFLYISLPLFARLRRVLWITQTSIDEILFLFLNLDVVPRNFMDYVNKHRRNFVFFLNLGMVPRNSIPGGFAIFDKVSG